MLSVLLSVPPNLFLHPKHMQHADLIFLTTRRLEFSRIVRPMRAKKRKQRKEKRKKKKEERRKKTVERRKKEEARRKKEEESRKNKKE